MTPQELKNSILQLAVQGRLVEQRPEEGTAEELYRQIQEEKQRLIKEGKIKKEKPLPEIIEDEVPFDIPESWKWVRLRDIVFNHGQVKPETTFSYIDIGSIDNKDNKLNDEEQLINPDKAPSRARKIVKLGDILYSTVRPYLHNICIINREFSNTPIASTGFAVLSCYNSVYNKYLFYYLLSPSFDAFANDAKNSKGVAYPAINDKRFYSAVIAIPPLAEQKRIVAKIEELLPYIDRYERAWSKLEDFNKRFPGDMQKSVLQMAIQGKLVEQRPEEGTGEELYRQIQAEKQSLIKEGKIKKEKPLPEISEDEIPFDIPESWKWVRFADIALFENGDRSKNYPVELDYVNAGIPFFGAKDIEGDKLSFEKVRFISLEKYNQLGRGKLQDNDFICLLRGSVGKCAVFNATVENDTGFICAQMVIIRCIDKKMCNYIRKYVLSPFYTLSIQSKTTGTAVKQLPAKELSKMIIPLPPLAEQKRIVQKLDKILPLCERLK